MPDVEPVCLIDGEYLDTLTIADRALHYGDGVFETIAIHQGQAQLWAAHMARLQQACGVLGLTAPDQASLAEESRQLCHGTAQGVLKIIISRGSGGRGYRAPSNPVSRRILIRYPWPTLPDREHGVRLRFCQTPLSCHPQLAGIKHLNRLEQVLARNEWQDDDIYEGLMCDPQGYLVEGCMSNLFAIQQGNLLTPDLGQCGIAGIMREQVLALANQTGVCVKQVRMKPAALLQMDEIFITNSLIGIVPVRKLAQQSYPIEQGLAWHRALQAKLEGQ